MLRPKQAVYGQISWNIQSVRYVAALRRGNMQSNRSRRARSCQPLLGALLNTLSVSPPLTPSVPSPRFSGIPRVGMLTTYPPTPCGIATFGVGLACGLEANGAEVGVVRVSDVEPSSSARVIAELVNGSAKSVAACAELLNESEVAVIQHDYGIFGGVDGDEVLDVMDALRVPSIVIAHNVLNNPTPHQREVFEAIAARTDQLIAMSQVARQQMCDCFDIDRRKVSVIPYGGTVPNGPTVVRNGRPTVLTWGFLGPGKGVEHVIEAMASLRSLPGRPRYLIAGRTHPKVLATEGEAYRDGLIEQVRRSGLTDVVYFEQDYRNVATLLALAQSAAVVVLPYDSTDQVTSGVLVDAIANGRPVVATAFPHAVELLGSGAGIVVGHNDPAALATALFQVLTQPRLAGAMAAEARRLSPEVAWPTVGGAYVNLARRIVAQQRARA